MERITPLAGSKNICSLCDMEHKLEHCNKKDCTNGFICNDCINDPLNDLNVCDSCYHIIPPCLDREMIYCSTCSKKMCDCCVNYSKEVRKEQCMRYYCASCILKPSPKETYAIVRDKRITVRGSNTLSSGMWFIEMGFRWDGNTKSWKNSSEEIFQKQIQILSNEKIPIIQGNFDS